MPNPRLPLVVILSAALLCAPAIANSQDTSSSNAAGLGISAAVVLWGGLLVLAFWGVTESVKNPGGMEMSGLNHEERDTAVAQVRQVLTDHRAQVRADIARGAGPFIDGLAVAQSLPIALRPRLGAALQAAHAALDAPLANGPPTAAGAVAFADALIDAVRADPVLAARVDLPRSEAAAHPGR